MKKVFLTLVSCMAAAAALAQPAPGRMQAPLSGEGRPAMNGHPEVPSSLSREDALKRAAAQFDAMDANKDGKLTADEMRTYHERMMASRAQQGMPHQGAPSTGPGAGEQRGVPGGMPSGMPSGMPFGGPNGARGNAINGSHPAERSQGLGRPPVGMPQSAERPAAVPAH